MDFECLIVQLSPLQYRACGTVTHHPSTVTQCPSWELRWAAGFHCVLSHFPLLSLLLRTRLCLMPPASTFASPKLSGDLSWDPSETEKFLRFSYFFMPPKGAVSVPEAVGHHCGPFYPCCRWVAALGRGRDSGLCLSIPKAAKSFLVAPLSPLRLQWWVSVSWTGSEGHRTPCCCPEGEWPLTDLPTLCWVVSNPEGKANAGKRLGKVHASSLGRELSLPCVDPCSVHEYSDICVSLTSPPKTAPGCLSCRMWVDLALHFLWTKAQSSWEMVSGVVISITLILQGLGEVGTGRIVRLAIIKRKKPTKKLFSLMLHAWALKVLSSRCL